MPGIHRERTEKSTAFLRWVECPPRGRAGHTHVEAGQHAGLSAGGLSSEGSRHLEPSPIDPVRESNAAPQRQQHTNQSNHELSRQNPTRRPGWRSPGAHTCRYGRGGS